MYSMPSRPNGRIKKIISNEKSKEIMKKERGKHFDPKLLDLFFEQFEEVLAIQEKYRMDAKFRTDLDVEEWR